MKVFPWTCVNTGSNGILEDVSKKICNAKTRTLGTRIIRAMFFIIGHHRLLLSVKIVARKIESKKVWWEAFIVVGNATP